MMGKVAVARRERLHRLCKSIVDDPASIDGDIKARLRTAAFKYAATQYDDPTHVLERLYHDDGELGSLLRRAVDVVTKQRARYDSSWESDRVNQINRARFDADAALDQNEELLGQDDEDKESDEDADDEELEKQADHHASTVADLLVEAGSFPHRAAALQHLLHKPSGQALLARMHKVAKHKESTMSTSEHLDAIVKRFGPVQLAKHIVETGKAPCSEADLVGAFTKAASEKFNMPGERAFDKLAAADASVLRACALCKAAEYNEMLYGPGLPVQVVTGPATRDVDDPAEAEAARAELIRIGRRQWPRLSEQDAYERAFTDPANAALTARLYHRPLPSSIYPMPNAWLRGDGSQHAAKADSGSAYGELMAKAEEYRNAHPELSIAQAFEKIYTDRANVELAKRERVESAPR
jgi:hypothetical protein